MNHGRGGAAKEINIPNWNEYNKKEKKCDERHFFFSSSASCLSFLFVEIRMDNFQLNGPQNRVLKKKPDGIYALRACPYSINCLCRMKTYTHTHTAFYTNKIVDNDKYNKYDRK